MGTFTGPIGDVPIFYPVVAPPDAKPEKIVRPFEAFRERKDQALERLRAVPGETFEAELCWGEAPDFTGTTGADPHSGFSTKAPGDTNPSPSPNRDLEWKEDKRETKKIRVENPDDPEQYVMVERIERLYMRAPSAEPFGGKRHKFTFENK